jgi:hypothetical protein
MFRQGAKRGLVRNSLVELITQTTAGGKALDRNLIMQAAILWLLLAGCSEGRALIEQNLGQALAGGRKTDKLVAAVRNYIRDNQPDRITVVLAFCAAIQRCDGSLPALIRNVLYEAVFIPHQSHVVVPQLNALAWAAILLISFDALGPTIDLTPLGNMWMDGQRLRSDRLDAVSELSADLSRLNRDNLEERRHRSLLEHARLWVAKVPTCVRADAEKTKSHSRDAFVSHMAGATFWGTAPQVMSSGSATTGLCGVLMVNLLNNRIEWDSPGYNRIFLHPFSLITGMNVVNLNGIRREFGDNDVELVKIMGETVVREVFVRSEQGFVSHGGAFFQRTHEILEQMRRENWNAEMGLDDLLKVLCEDGRKTRWVHRSALIYRPRSPNANPIISWRFVEMPANTAELVVTVGKTQ